MRTNILLLLVALLVVCTIPSHAELKTLAEWRFNTDGDSAGWSVTGNVEGLTAKDGNLIGRVTGRDPSIAGPQIDVAAAPFQYVEIRMRTTQSGSGELFYTNTTEEPFGGFRSDMFQRIQYKAGDYQVYRIYPFWQSLDKIVRVRVDPPENCEFAIDYVKIVEIGTGSSATHYFDFTKPDQVWSSADDFLVDTTADGVTVKGPGEWMLVSPKVDFDADSQPFLSLGLRSTGADQVVLRWITEGKTAASHRLKLKNDDRWHVYNIAGSELPSWSGRITGLAIEGNLDEGQQVQIKAAGASTKRQGPAELDVRNFRLKDAVNRVNPNRPAILQAEMANTGGETVRDEITVRFRISAGNKLDITPVDLPSAVGLKSGASAMMTFEVVPEHPGASDVQLTVDNTKTSGSASASLLWYPPVDAKSSSYVPEPVPAKGDYEVGVYYYPGWNSYRAWGVLNSFPERRPLLGYYKEGDPEVADWQIKWMVEHGITFIVYDWYWSAGNRHLEHALHEGFFNARYRDKIKFCLLWANHNQPKTSSAEDMVAVTNYWLDNYFLRPEYMKVDGKPVVVIFSPHRLTEDMGSDGVRAALDKSREMAKAKGLNGIYFVACTYPGNTKVLEQEGYDALSGYNYPSAGDKGQMVAPYADNVTGYQEFWNTIADNTSLRYIPVTDPGWDSRPWHGANARVRTDKTPALFKQMLENAKTFVDKRHPDASPKMVLVEAWNEFGEGDYIEPTAGFGFGHLDAIREVFTSAPVEHDDIVPQDVGMGLIEMAKPKPVTSWEFTDRAPGWDPLMGLKDSKFVEGSLTAVTTSADPALTVWTEDLDSSRFGAVEIRLKVDRGRGAQLFWSTPAWRFTEGASTTFELQADGQFHTYKLDLTKSPSWKSKIVALRFDPTDATDANIAIDYIRFLRR